MAFGYKSVRDAIVTKLGTLVPATLAVVYSKEEKAIKQFPAATVSAKQHSAALNDSVSNMKTYEHFIRIYFRTDETNDPDYEDVLEAVADTVISTLEHDLTLGNVVDWSLPTGGVWKNVQKETPTRMLELTFISKARVVR